MSKAIQDFRFGRKSVIELLHKPLSGGVEIVTRQFRDGVCMEQTPMFISEGDFHLLVRPILNSMGFKSVIDEEAV